MNQVRDIVATASRGSVILKSQDDVVARLRAEAFSIGMLSGW